MEVKILVAEIGLDADGRSDQPFHILYDGTVVDDGWIPSAQRLDERHCQAKSSLLAIAAVSRSCRLASF